MNNRFIIQRARGLLSKLKHSVLYLPKAFDRSVLRRHLKRKALRAFYGEREAFIIASGPSVARLDFDKFSDKPVMMLNASVRLADQLPFQPRWFFLADQTFLKNPEVRQAAIAAIELGADIIMLSNPTFIDRRVKSFDVDAHIFRSDVLSCGINYLTNLGYTRIVILGLDWSYTVTNKSTDVAKPPESVNRLDQHFQLGNKNPYAGIAWRPPQLQWKMNAMTAASSWAEQRGVRVINATDVTRCDIFPIEAENYRRLYSEFKTGEESTNTSKNI